MKTKDILKLENIVYPSGRFAPVGENLRVLTRNEFSHIPPIKPKRTQTVYPIIVPTSRNVRKNRKTITHIMELAMQHEGGLVLFLCSGKATKEDIAALARDHDELNWIAIDGPYPYDHHHKDFETTYSSIANTSEKDTPQKRNLGLEIARLMNWESVFFLDDDIAITPGNFYKAMDLLHNRKASIAGFSARSFPDHSVVVHAERLVNGPIDTFIGTGALAVKADTQVLSFFPHIYNEDWLFLLIHCLFAEGNVVWAGTIEQQPYNPFKDARRAIGEEPGDMLGEGLMRLAMSISPIVQKQQSFEAITTALAKTADEQFWENEINTRIAFIRATKEKIRRRRIYVRNRYRVLRVLEAAQERLVGKNGQGGIKASQLAQWVQAWVRDLNRLNTVRRPANSPKDLTGVMQSLGFKERYMYSCDASLLLPLSLLPDETTANEPRIPSIEPGTSYFDHTMIPLRPKVAQGLENTQIIQNYLISKGLDMTHIVDSAVRLRFDRPVVSLDSKPIATISMFIAYGESLEHVTTSVRDIIRWNKRHSPLQLIIWVYGERDKSYGELDMYRNKVVTRLVCEVSGTNVRLRSSIITDNDNNIDRVISKGLSDLAFAYWQCNIPTDHHVFVVNSRNEILRYGTFWEFMREEHKMSGPSLAAFLQSLPQLVGRGSKNPLTAEDDEIALAKARERLIEPSTRLVRPTWLRKTPTANLVKQMRRARLTWLELDELAYATVFHDRKGEALLAASDGILCIPVQYKKDLPSDKYAIARKVNLILQTHRTKRHGCMIIIQANGEVSQKEIEQYRKKLMKYITAQNEQSSTVFLSFTDKNALDISAAKFKIRSMAVAQYMYWLSNHHQKPAIVWETLDSVRRIS